MALHIDYALDIDQLPAECIADCCHAGDCSEDVSFWRQKLDFTVDRSKAIECLEGYGAWEIEELEAMSDEDIAERILWIACGNFSEQMVWEAENPGKSSEDSDYGTSVFVLE